MDAVCQIEYLRGQAKRLGKKRIEFFSSLDLVPQIRGRRPQCVIGLAVECGHKLVTAAIFRSISAVSGRLKTVEKRTWEPLEMGGGSREAGGQLKITLRFF